MISTIQCCLRNRPIFESVSPLVRLVGSDLIVPAAVAVAVAASYLLGASFGASRNASILGAVALGSACAGAAYALNLCVAEVAVGKLQGYMTASHDPTSLKTEDMEAILNLYGVSKKNKAIKAELCYWYFRFVSATFPPGGKCLEGNEVEKIIKFKNSLGLHNPYAAPVHMAIGKLTYREMLENIHPQTVKDHSRAFKKLLFVSSLVFGQLHSLYLSWRCVLSISDAQFEDAIRENAPSMYAFKLKSIGRDLDVKQLISLREAQLLYPLSDNTAENMFRGHTEELVEENILAALNMLKSTAGAVEASNVIEEIDKILVFDDLLISLSNHPDTSRFARGVGSIRLFGDDKNTNDLKQLYSA